MVDEVVNNRQNWNAIDDVTISSSITSPIASENKENGEKEELDDKSKRTDDKIDKAIFVVVSDEIFRAYQRLL